MGYTGEEETRREEKYNKKLKGLRTREHTFTTQQQLPHTHTHTHTHTVCLALTTAGGPLQAMRARPSSSSSVGNASSSFTLEVRGSMADCQGR